MNILLWVLQIILAIKLLTVTLNHGLRPDPAKMRRGRERFGALTRPLLAAISLLALLTGLGLVLPFASGFLPVTTSVTAGMLLIATGYSHSSDHIPGWIVLACYTAMGLGTMFGGWRIVKTMGNRITKLNQARGFCANSGGAVTLFVATAFGIPVSTTHTITGAIAGVGSTRGARRVRWGVAGGIVWAWILTIPCSAAMAAIAWYIGMLVL